MRSLILAALFFAQASTPAFEVATIKPTGAVSGVTGGCRGIDSKLGADDPRNAVPLGRCVIKAGRLSHMMSTAFGMPLQRISGFPDWDRPNRFDVEAKADDPASTTEQQLLLMLQKFLTEQFKLTIHRDTKEVPTFSLLVAKNGTKNLHPSKELRESMMPQGSVLAFKGFTMQGLAEFLSPMPGVERPIKDMTGLEGRYDFNLDVLGTQTENIGDAKMAMARWETVFSDLQQQLGLRLGAARGAVDSLVIDHAELPK